VPLVEDVTFDVARRQMCGLVGETGAGKTMTMKALLGLLPPGVHAGGEMRLGDGAWQSIGDQGRHRRAALGREYGVVLQNPAGMLDPLVRVGSQLVEGVTRRKQMRKREARARAEELLRAVGFRDPSSILALYPHQLSGGMSQRVGIVMALMPRPAVLVVDEPTSALDAQLRVEVLEMIRGAALDHDCAVVLISHDLSLVSHFCDDIVVLYAGHVLEQGPQSTVLADPRQPYTQALIACAPTLEADRGEPLPTIPGTAPAPGSWPTGCLFQPRCPLAFDRCERERPELRPIQQRLAACHIAEQTADGLAARNMTPAVGASIEAETNIAVTESLKLDEPLAHE
jgi:oligopeptide/dipeptide ABC transporter ATP-binding protein